MSKRSGGGHVRSIWRRDKRKCWLCGNGVAQADASRDHLKVRSKGGYDKSENYRLAHKDCNGARGDLDEVYVKIVQFYFNLASNKNKTKQAMCEALRRARHEQATEPIQKAL